MNDEAAVKGSRDGRKLNRHNFSIEEIEQAVERPVVKKLLALIDFRNTYPAFSGEFTVDDCNGPLLTLTWQKGKFKASLSLDFTRSAAEIMFFDPDEGTERVLSLHDLN
jgi:sucrose phosphorylase